MVQVRKIEKFFRSLGFRLRGLLTCLKSSNDSVSDSKINVVYFCDKSGENYARDNVSFTPLSEKAKQDKSIEPTPEQKDSKEDLIQTPVKDLSNVPTKDLALEDFEHVATIGVGCFGRVDLVYVKNDKSRIFAMKKMKKAKIVGLMQQQHVLNEKKILFQLDSQFIIKLYKTYHEGCDLNMLMEPCCGGELFSLLRIRNILPENDCKFYMGSIQLALDHLHSRHIVYRDLKPENILLDQYGYIKLVDFGFSKDLSVDKHTRTFCGTPDYMAPEILLCTGHDQRVDIWAMGVLLFELVSGRSPFTSEQPMVTYHNIMKGFQHVLFPKNISFNLRLLILKLCRLNVNERMDLTSFRNDIWFQDFDWMALEQRSMRAPYVPLISSSVDVSNFDSYQPEQEDDNNNYYSGDSGWENDF